jgi:HD-GYP domain-containing protein (c-di-GMP phosphodiesterase class II)
MKELDVNDLEVNTILDGELYLDSRGDLLLGGLGIPVTTELVDTLKSWSIKSIYTTGTGRKVSLAKTDISEAVASNEAEEEEGRKFARDTYTELYQQAEKIYNQYIAKGDLSIDRITELIKSIMAALRHYRRFILRFGDYSELRKEYFIAHAVETAILSIAIGENLKMPSHRLIELGLAAFLHEIGLLRMPKDILNAKRALSAEESKLLSTHVIVGFKILKEFSLPIDVLMGVLQHHERIDGSGYVQGLQGDAITLYARIIGIACSYHAQIADRPFRGAKDQHLSLVGMVKDMGKHYDDRLLKYLLQNLSLFPIGTGVKLSNGSYGIVVDANPDDATKPTVQILCDASGLVLTPPQTVVISQDIGIAKVLTSQELQAVNEKVAQVNNDKN